MTLHGSVEDVIVHVCGKVLSSYTCHLAIAQSTEVMHANFVFLINQVHVLLCFM